MLIFSHTVHRTVQGVDTLPASYTHATSASCWVLSSWEYYWQWRMPLEARAVSIDWHCTHWHCRKTRKHPSYIDSDPFTYHTHKLQLSSYGYFSPLAKRCGIYFCTRRFVRMSVNRLHRACFAGDRRARNFYKKLANKNGRRARRHWITFSFNADRTFVRNITFIACKTCGPSTIQSSNVLSQKSNRKIS